MDNQPDEMYMDIAIEQAQQAWALAEVPIGAVVVFEDRVIAAAHNRREINRDPTAHAEILALSKASRVLGRWRLTGCELFVTLEPCIMCAGAAVMSRIERLVFGATDPKGGAVASLYTVASDPRLNHRMDVVGGVREEVCGRMLSEFFKARR